MLSENTGYAVDKSDGCGCLAGVGHLRRDDLMLETLSMRPDFLQVQTRHITIVNHICIILDKFVRTLDVYLDMLVMP